MDLQEWSRFLFDVASWTLALIAIFEGTRRLVGGHRNRIAIALLIGGIAWCALRGGANLYVAEGLDSVVAVSNLRPTAELKDDWGSGLAPEERERASLAYAMSVYRSTGKLITYFDRSGVRRTLAPNDIQLRQREYAIAVEHRMDDVARNAYESGLRWLLSALLALVAGFLTGRHGSRDANDSRSKGI